MIKYKSSWRVRQIVLLASIWIGLAANPSTVNAETPVKDDVAGEPLGPAVDLQKMQEILARQKSGKLELYLRDATRIYVQGKKISLEELKWLVEERAFSSAIVAANREVRMRRVHQIDQHLRKSGINEILFKVSSLPEEVLAEQTLEKTRADQETRADQKTLLKTIVARQKDDTLRVYLQGSQRTFVNGKKVAKSLLVDLVGTMKFQRAIITSSPEVQYARVVEILKLLQKAKVTEIQVIADAQESVSAKDAARN